MYGQIHTTKKQEDELLIKIQKGTEKESEEAWIKLFELLHPLIYGIAAYYVNMGLTKEQLVGLGRIGLREAVRKYHGFKDDYKFSVYASWFIREEIHKKLGIKDEA